MEKKYFSKFNPELIKMKMYRNWLKETERNDGKNCSMQKMLWKKLMKQQNLKKSWKKPKQMLKIRRNALKSCDLKQNSQKSGFFIKPLSIIGHIIQYMHNCYPYLAIFDYLKIYLNFKISPWNLLKFQNPNSVDTLLYIT